MERDVPIYEYECPKCLKRFDLKKRFDDDSDGICPVCGSNARRLFSPACIILKGSGFSTTDSKEYQRQAEESKNVEAMERSLGED